MHWTILVVDENRDFFNQLNQAIELAKNLNPFNLKQSQVPSIELNHAGDGKTAFRNLMRGNETGRSYQLVILSQELPGDWDGLETLVRLGKSRPIPNCLLLVDNLKRLDREMIQKAWETTPFHLLMRPKSTEELDLYMAHCFFNPPWEKPTGENLDKLLPSDDRAERLQALLAKRKEENHQLTEKLTDLQQAFDRKSEYLTVMSHEIRTPLSSILGMVEILQVSDLDDKQQDIAGSLLESSESLLSLINDVLDMAKIEAGKMTLDLQPFSLEKWIVSIFHMMQEKASKNGNKLEYHLDPGLPQVLMGDRDKLRQILINLLNNANKYTRNGRIMLTIGLQQRLNNKITLEFKVSDSGTGIPREKLENLFKPFIQLKKPETREAGTGLGLVVCKRLVEMMEGSIGVQSQEGLGSTFLFSVTLGLNDSDEPTHHLTQQRQPVPLPERQKADQTILLVEDNPTNQKVAHIHLAHAGYKVITAENGEVALAQLKSNAVDLILMDLQMPIMDGFEATRCIRADLGLKIPIVALSANVFGEHRTRCFEIGMDDFIPKPIRRKNFLGIISKWLGQVEVTHFAKTSSEGGPVFSRPESLVGQDEPINYARAVREFEGEQDLVREVLREFLLNTEKKMPIMARFIFETNYEDLEDQAHALKGGSGNLCAQAFAFAARDLEKAAAARDPHQVLLAFMDLQRSFGSLKEFCRTHPKLKL